MIRITKIESVLGDFGIHYYRKRTEETAAAIKAISAAVGERIFGDILTAIDGAESEAFKDGIELGRVYGGSGFLVLVALPPWRGKFCLSLPP